MEYSYCHLWFLVNLYVLMDRWQRVMIIFSCLPESPRKALEARMALDGSWTKHAMERKQGITASQHHVQWQMEHASPCVMTSQYFLHWQRGLSAVCRTIWSENKIYFTFQNQVTKYQQIRYFVSRGHKRQNASQIYVLLSASASWAEEASVKEFAESSVIQKVPKGLRCSPSYSINRFEWLWLAT